MRKQSGNRVLLIRDRILVDDIIIVAYIHWGNVDLMMRTQYLKPYLHWGQEASKQRYS